MQISTIADTQPAPTRAGPACRPPQPRKPWALPTSTHAGALTVDERLLHLLGQVQPPPQLPGVRPPAQCVVRPPADRQQHSSAQGSPLSAPMTLHDLFLAPDILQPMPACGHASACRQQQAAPTRTCPRGRQSW
jgi:hypothetical protein